MELSWSTDDTHQESTLLSVSGNGSSATTELVSELDHYQNHSQHDHYANETYTDDIIFNSAVQTIFYMVYATIFVLGIFGNVLVCFVVGRNKAMQTVTNFFITNLALADILLCALAVPFTPLYTFLGEWVFGSVLCHLVAYAQGASVYISTLTLTSIAIDRFFVIIYPFKPRMRITTCLLIITGIWAFALLATLPYGIYLHYKYEEKYICIEAWPSEDTRKIFGGCTVTLQFILPFIIILFCYIKVSIKLSDRAKAKPGSKNSKKEALERERKRRTNRMLIAMVFIFGVSWLPINVVNFLTDVYTDWAYSNLCFFVAHAVAMSSTCYNPFLYAWLNENFRKEFKQVLPCFHAASQGNSNRSKRFVSQRNCNGAETVQESLMPTTSQQINANNTHPAGGGAQTVMQVLDTIDELNSSSHSAPVAVVSIELQKASATFTTAETNEVIVHFPGRGEQSTTTNNDMGPGGSVNNSGEEVDSTSTHSAGGGSNSGKSPKELAHKGNNTSTRSGGPKRKPAATIELSSSTGASLPEEVDSNQQDPFEDEPCNAGPDMINLKTFAVNSVLI